MALYGWGNANFLSTTTPPVTARPFMITAWVYPTWTTDGPYAVVTIGQDGSGDNYWMLRGDHASLDVDAIERDASTFIVSQGSMTSAAWNPIAGGYISTSLLEVYEGSTRNSTTSVGDAGTPDAMRIGQRLTSTSRWSFPSGDAIAEIVVWDATGMTQANREALKAKIDAGENPVAINAEIGQPWSGAAVSYWTLENTTDGLVDQIGSNDLTLNGSLSVFGSHPSIDELAPDPATISRPSAVITTERQSDTITDVFIETLDATAVSHVLYGYTSDLGSDPAAWEASADVIDSSLSAGSLADDWEGRDPNTDYYFAVVSTGSGGGKVVSARLGITTAFARPTGATVVSTTASTATIEVTDASGGLAYHMFFVRESADPLSALELRGVVEPGGSLEFTYVDLVDGTEYSFEVAAWDGNEIEADARLSGLTAITATPSGSSIPIFAHHYRQMAAA